MRGVLQNQREHHIILIKYEEVHPTDVSEINSSNLHIRVLTTSMLLWTRFKIIAWKQERVGLLAGQPYQLIDNATLQCHWLLNILNQSANNVYSEYVNLRKLSFKLHKTYYPIAGQSTKQYGQLCVVVPVLLKPSFCGREYLEFKSQGPSKWANDPSLYKMCTKWTKARDHFSNQRDHNEKWGE